MNDMIDRVLLIFPGCDRNEVENDLNLTGDVEWTINRALDGVLSPLKTPSEHALATTEQVKIMDDSDDIITLPSTSKYTAIKERPAEVSLNERQYTDVDRNSKNLHSNTVNSTFTEGLQQNSGQKHKGCNSYTLHEISDSDSEKDEISINSWKDYKKSKASEPSVASVSKKSSKDFEAKFTCRAPSPESDDEILPPAFGDSECDSYSTITKDTYKEVCQESDLVKHTSSSYTGLNNDNRQQPVPMNAGIGKRCSSDEVTTCINQEVPVKKKKRTKEEIEEQKKAALLKKEAKEKERQEKLEEKKKQKEARAAELLEKKLRLEKEKLQKKADKLTKSTTKLDGCIKFITVCIDPSIFSDDSSGPNDSIILQKLCSMEASYKIEQQLYPSSITWQRTNVQHSVCDGELMITSTNTYSEEDEVLVILEAKHFAEMVYVFKQESQGKCETLDQEEHQTLVDFTRDVKTRYEDKTVTFLLVGLEKYMRSVKTKQQRAFRDAATRSSEETENNRKRRKKKITATVDVTRTDIEEALVDLQIKTNVCVYPCETEEDVAMKVALFTKAVAEKPYKKSLTDGFGFCLDKLDKTSLKVSKDGLGLISVWQQQIEQFRNVSREMAAAIVAVFPSPQRLLEAYEQCGSEEDAMLLLEDILVRRGGGSLATSRRIGPELSKRFYILFHSRESGELMKR